MNNAKKIQREYWLYLTSGLLLLILLGYISESFIHYRMDFTENRQYTLSAATRKTLAGLEDQVSVRAVFSENLPAQFAQIRTHAEDLLEEFATESQGKLRVRYDDPGLDSARRAQVIQEGIREIQVTEQTRDGAVAKRGFFGLVISYGDKKEIVPLVESIESFEYDVVVKIKRLTGKTAKIGIFEGSGAGRVTLMLPQETRMAPVSGFGALFPSLLEEIRNLYDVTVLPGGDIPVPEDVGLLLVSAPSALSDGEKYAIDQYIMRGGNVLFMAPAVQVEFSQGLFGQPAGQDLNEFLNNYGFTVQPHIVMDQRHAMANFGVSPFGTPYPHFVLASEEGVNRENVMTSKLGTLILPWTADISVKPDSGTDVRTEILLKTSAKAWVQSAPYDLMPKDPGKGERYIPTDSRVLNLAVMRNGIFNSAFSAPPVNNAEFAGQPHRSRSEKKATLLVMPNVLFATDFFVRWSSFMGQSSLDNLNFIMNAVDYLALDPEFIEIRSKKVTLRPVDDKAYDERYSWNALNMLSAPALLLVIGLTVFVRRKIREKKVWHE